MSRMFTSIAVAAVAFVGLAAGQAEAASQALGLVASNGLPTPLHCQDGICAGHFSAFCLQEARPAPSADSEYRLAPGSELTLIASMPDGKILRLSGNDLVTIRTRIGFTSVRMTLPESKLKSLGAISLAVEVEPMTSILPTPIANDPNPQSAEEIAFATGAMRRLAQRPFEMPGEAADAARLSNLVINLLPEDEPQTASGRDAIWNQVMTLAGSSRSFTSAGIAAGQQIYAGCEIALASKSAFSLRSCMELRHADLMAQTNRNFWDSSGGS